MWTEGFPMLSFKRRLTTIQRWQSNKYIAFQNYTYFMCIISIARLLDIIIQNSRNYFLSQEITKQKMNICKTKNIIVTAIFKKKQTTTALHQSFILRLSSSNSQEQEDTYLDFSQAIKKYPLEVIDYLVSRITLKNQPSMQGQIEETKGTKGNKNMKSIQKKNNDGKPKGGILDCDLEIDLGEESQMLPVYFILKMKEEEKGSYRGKQVAGRRKRGKKNQKAGTEQGNQIQQEELQQEEEEYNCNQEEANLKNSRSLGKAGRIKRKKRIQKSKSNKYQ